MNEKPRRYVSNQKADKVKFFKPIIYKTIFSIGIILFVLLLQSLNFKSTKWIVGKVKYVTEYETDIKASSLKYYDSIKGFVKGSKDKIPVLNMSPMEKYMSPIEGEIYQAYEKGINDGVDIKSSDGGDAKSIIQGEVKDVYLQENKGYFVTIQEGDIEVTYGYLSKSYVSKDEILDIETPIGVLGTNKDGNKYLRIELKVDGQYQNPLEYIDLK